jgi:histone deacetylase complex regulatory component SIN3
MGYTGAVKMFDIFRKHVVGDVIITRADEERYNYDSVLDTMSTLVKELNLLINKSAP